MSEQHDTPRPVDLGMMEKFWRPMEQSISRSLALAMVDEIRRLRLELKKVGELDRLRRELDDHRVSHELLVVQRDRLRRELDDALAERDLAQSEVARLTT